MEKWRHFHSWIRWKNHSIAVCVHLYVYKSESRDFKSTIVKKGKAAKSFYLIEHQRSRKKIVFHVIVHVSLSYLTGMVWLELDDEVLAYFR